MINEINVKVKKLSNLVTMPTYASTESAGADLYSAIERVEILPHQTVMIKTGLSFEMPQGIVGLVYARSGLATKRDLAPANKVGVIDSDYRGEIMVPIHNHGNNVQVIECGDRIAQIIFTPYFKAQFDLTENLTTTVRGESGFGSSGK